MKNKEHKLSIIMPVYNKEKYLNEAIDSVLNQTYKDFEFIILNDGSTDNSKEIIQEYTDPRIKYIEHDNMGISKTLNKGISLCKGKYIGRVDADDICLPKKFEQQMDYVENNPNIAMLGGGIIRITEKGETLSYDIPYIGSKIINYILFNKGNAIKQPTIIFKKEAAIDVGGYDEEINCFFEDYHFCAKVAQKGYLIENLNIPILKYRITPGSIMSSKHNDEFIKMTLRVINSGKYTEEDKKIMAQKKEHNKNKETLKTYKERIANEKKGNLNIAFNFTKFFIGETYAFKFFTFLKYCIARIIYT